MIVQSYIGNDIDLIQLIKDVELNETLITQPFYDKCELIFECPSFKTLNKIILDEIYKINPFDEKLYMKKIYTKNLHFKKTNNIFFEKNISLSTKVLSQYSFLLSISEDELIIKMNNNTYILESGSILIFNTTPLIENKSEMNNGIIIYGSYSVNLFDTELKKEFI